VNLLANGHDLVRPAPSTGHTFFKTSARLPTVHLLPRQLSLWQACELFLVLSARAGRSNVSSSFRLSLPTTSTLTDGLARYSEDDSSRNTTSSLPYINAQLVSHGFSRRPLDLTDLRTRDQEQTVKCLFSMLQQRVVRIAPYLLSV
jgi:hypothetical protein